MESQIEIDWKGSSLILDVDYSEFDGMEINSMYMGGVEIGDCPEEFTDLVIDTIFDLLTDSSNDIKLDIQKERAGL